MSNSRAVVIKPISSVTQKPELNGELSDELLHGMTVDILAEEGQWLNIKTHYNYLGYIRKDDVLMDKTDLWEKYDKSFIISSFADIKNQPKYSSYGSLTIPRGSQVAFIGENEGNWTKVMLPIGETGWVRKEALLSRDAETGPALRQSIVDTALLYLGTQYRWGGKSPMGIDCSGLSSMAYMLNGIIIPRDSGDQMEFMKKIDRRYSKPGDLLFFPGHVAIYIGEDKFVHSTGMDAVVEINSLNKDSRLYRKDLDEKYICTGTVL